MGVGTKMWTDEQTDSLSYIDARTPLKNGGRNRRKIHNWHKGKIHSLTSFEHRSLFTSTIAGGNGGKKRQRGREEERGERERGKEGGKNPCFFERIASIGR